MSCIAYPCFWIEFVINCMRRRRRRKKKSEMKMKLQFIYDDLDIDHSLYINGIIAVKFAATFSLPVWLLCSVCLRWDCVWTTLPQLYSTFKQMSVFIHKNKLINILSFKFIIHPDFEWFSSTRCPGSRCHFKYIGIMISKRKSSFMGHQLINASKLSKTSNILQFYNWCEDAPNFYQSNLCVFCRNVEKLLHQMPIWVVLFVKLNENWKAIQPTS